jgi:DNA-binding transcriptional LysR family regulator
VTGLEVMRRVARGFVFGRLYVLPAVNEFIAQYPEINVRLLLSDRNVHLIDDHIDLAVRIGPLADSSFVATRVGAVRRVVCASPDYLAGRRNAESARGPFLTRLHCF